jgi:hypothetical protein
LFSTHKRKEKTKRDGSFNLYPNGRREKNHLEQENTFLSSMSFKALNVIHL